MHLHLAVRFLVVHCGKASAGARRARPSGVLFRAESRNVLT